MVSTLDEPSLFEIVNQYDQSARQHAQFAAERLLANSF
jgi:hypothetical protein